ncbi:MAG: cupredoxin domain-containing protein [Acidimicrobiales bacterium]
MELEGEVNDHGTVELAESSLEMEQDDFYFGPTFVKAEPGSTVTVDLINEGDADHTFTVEEQGIDAVLEPGGRQSVEVTVPDGGTLVFVCRFHLSQGMQGAFVAG